MDETPFQPQALSPEETALEENTREGLRALFHWAVFPFPLALIPLFWLSKLPFVGVLFSLAGVIVLVVWAVRAWERWGAIDWAAKLDALRQGYQKVSRGTQGESRLADEARIEGTTAIRAVAMDTVEGDIQVAGQRDAWTTQIGRLEAIYDRDRAQELLLRQLRRNVADLDKAEALRHATPAALGNVRMASLGAVGRPQGFLGGLPVPGLRLPIAWVLVAVLALVSALQTLRVERVKNDARDLQDAVAAETDRANAAETQARMNEVALESTRHEVNVSRELNETLQARQERLEARQRRSSREQVDAARGGRPVDLDGRLRELTLQPFASPDPGASPAADPAGGMHERPAGALDLSTPDALPTGHDWPGAGDSDEPG